ncbi:Dynamitin-domain-containing protein [Colletotrichum godetiae]|uniref:Dynamitin-domain-containing protein n=1 Tax=Colletotrichum godetiae TaxID=1209918 RepID=A0AAJ0AW70_9PEZI|nr:Dynamitin-domain-containing protein [Colletotrichum godetiae]KAK1690953.1 Dynamitin-domain-containing protein [Colletotrichum godetiae]
MALNRKYAALPDLDSAPDVYETPELTDDTSTVPTTTGQSHSDDDFDDDLDDDANGISRSRLRVDEARSRFLPAGVDASGVDFSDRVDGKRKSYKASTRRQRFLQDGTEQLGDLSDEDDEDSLERKIARLQREVEEAKEEYGKRKEAAAQPTTGDHDEKLGSLSKVLDEISKTLEPHTSTSRALQPVSQPPTATKDESQGLVSQGNSATYTVTYAPTYEQSHALATAADFDRRLVLLERAIGVGSTALPEVDINGLPRAILPTLDGLQKQITTLSQASTSNLDTISRRVRTLIQEAQELEKARQGAKSAQETLGNGAATGEDVPAPEQLAKINALYGILPTIENLAPLLPPLLDRLRSLRAIHSDAASAGEMLSRIEKQQTDMATDLKQWKGGLEKVEEAMKEGGTAMSGNMKVMEAWVKDLEGRIAKLP